MNHKLVEFFYNIKFNEDNWCWEWQKSLSQGYGYFKLNKNKHSVHRISYMLFKGPIPIELELDHLCRNTRCCNPDHLQAVPHKENVLRGLGPTAINAQKTYCINGHKFSPENTFIRTNGNRDCRECMYVSKRKSYIKNQDKVNAQTLQHYHDNKERINARRRELWNIRQERRLAGDLLAAERCTMS